MVNLARFRSPDPSFADLVPYAALVDNGVILLKDGSLMAGWYFAGPDSESATDLERNEISRQINTVLARLGSGWMIQIEAVRLAAATYPDACRSHFPDPIARAIDGERRAHFEREGAHFESRHALILTQRPLEASRRGLGRYVYADPESRKKGPADTALDLFRTRTREVEQYLANWISLRRMQTRELGQGEGARRHRYDELFQFIRFCITGENHPVRLPDIAMRPWMPLLRNGRDDRQRRWPSQRTLLSLDGRAHLLEFRAVPTTHERTIGMKKPSSRIREEIAKLQEQLRQAETREAERIGRIALKAGLGEIEVDELELQSAFEKLAARFRESGRTAVQGTKTPSLRHGAPQGGAEGA